MLVAGWTVHRANGFFIVKSGWEYNFVLAIAAVAIAVMGSGRFSLDHLLGVLSPCGFWGLVIAGVGGLLAGMTQLAIFYRPPAKSDEPAGTP
jgi:putative oxidoreductase